MKLTLFLFFFHIVLRNLPVAYSQLSSCYLTSTVIFGNFTASPIPNVTLSTTLPPAFDSGSATSASASYQNPSSTISVAPTNLIYITINNANTEHRKRGVNYVGFNGDDGIIIPTKDAASIFYLVNGYLKSEDDFVGATSSNAYSNFHKFETPPADSSGWAANETSLSFGNASFCEANDGGFYIVFTLAPSFECTQVALTPLPGPAGSLAAVTTAYATSSSSFLDTMMSPIAAFASTSDSSDSLTVSMTLMNTASSDSSYRTTSSIIKISTSILSGPDSMATKSVVSSLASTTSSAVDLIVPSTYQSLIASASKVTLALLSVSSSVVSVVNLSTISLEPPSTIIPISPTSSHPDASSITQSNRSRSCSSSSSSTITVFSLSSTSYSGITTSPISSVSSPFLLSSSAAIPITVTPTLLTYVSTSSTTIALSAMTASSVTTATADIIIINSTTTKTMTTSASTISISSIVTTTLTAMVTTTTTTSPAATVITIRTTSASNTTVSTAATAASVPISSSTSTMSSTTSMTRTTSPTMTISSLLTSLSTTPTTTPIALTTTRADSITTTTTTAAPTTTTTTTTTPTTRATTTSPISPASPLPTHSTGKRGLAYTNITLTQFYGLPNHSSQVSWAYDYYSLPNASNNAGSVNPLLTFVPLLYNDADALTSIWPANVNYSIAHYNTDAVLAFNEPDGCSQGQSACMSVAASVAGYRTFIQPLAGRVLLGAPAVTNGPAPASLTYLSYFLGNCTNCTVDFVPLHWYASPYSFAYLQSYVQQAYQVAGQRPLWITELGMDSQYYADADVQAFMKNATTWLDAQSYVVRYAWFGDFDGYLVDSAGDGLSAQGAIWNNYTGGYVGS